MRHWYDMLWIHINFSPWHHRLDTNFFTYICKDWRDVAQVLAAGYTITRDDCYWLLNPWKNVWSNETAPVYDCSSFNCDCDFYDTFSIQELEVLALLVIVNFLMDILSKYSCHWVYTRWYYFTLYSLEFYKVGFHMKTL